MQRRLTYAGMRPINNIVDITNYVMLEWGQPLHAFDYDKLVARAGGKAPIITVRPAREGERLRTLDGEDRPLTIDMLLIADETGPIALAGVMGGAETEVTEATTSVLLESANFDFLSIRQTMKALNLPSEASYRFSRGIHPATVQPAIERACELMRQHAGATVGRGLVDNYPSPPPPRVIELRLVEVRRLLGIDLPLDECVRLLRALDFQVEKVGPDALRATAPPNRLDIQEGPADLIEDLARLHGYDRLATTLPADQPPEQAANEPLAFEEQVRDLLTGVGLQEVITYSLTTPAREAPLGLPPAEYVRLINPISSERVVMRHSVLAGVLEILAANLEHSEDVRLFEVGSVYLPRPGEKLPDEPRRLALALTGKRGWEFWNDAGARPADLDFYDLKGIMETLFAGLHLAGVAYRPASWPALHPGRSAELAMDGNTVGWFGELHPKVVEQLKTVDDKVYKKLEGRAVLVADLDLEVLQASLPPRCAYVPVPRFPAALRDIAIVVEERVPAEQVVSEIRTAGGSLLRGARLFDLYRGEGLGAGRKSLAYALTYQAEDRTLTDKEVDKAHEKIEKRLQHVLKALIRGKE
jgi:phenylalanyl-tRNA synthetase beta chain